jgi:hypothetical protein
MAELSLYKINIDKANKTGDTFSGQITSTVSDKSPFILDTGAANHIVANLNADKLDGYDASSFLLSSGSTPTGDITFNMANKGIVWSGLTDKHSIFLEEYATAESTRLVIQNADNADSDYTVFRSINGTTPKDVLEIHNTYIKTPVQIQSTITTGTAPFTVVSTTKVNNLNAELLNGLNSNDFSLKEYTTASTTVYEQVTMYNQYNNSMQGIIKITLPKSWSSTMLNITINGYDHKDYGAYKLILGGCNRKYSSFLSEAAQWVNCSASLIGKSPFNSISFGYDGTKCCILLGVSTTRWAHPVLYIDKVIASFDEQTGWETGWNIQMINDNIGVDNIVTVNVAEQPHDLVDSTKHTVSGLMTNDLLTATGATTFGFRSAATHGNHVPTIQAADNAKFLRNDNTWATITPANIGAASISHGNHVPTTTAVNNTTFLRNDNTWHQLTLGELGAAPTLHGNHVPTSPTTIKTCTFLRSDNVWQDVTPNNIGAAPSGFGLGSIANRLTAGYDLNSVLGSGWYDVNSPVNGVPLAVSGTAMTWHSVLVICSGDVNYVTQMAFSMTDGSGTCFIRQKKSTWGSWTKIALSSEVVSKFGDAITGNLSISGTLGTGGGATIGGYLSVSGRITPNLDMYFSNAANGKIYFAPGAGGIYSDNAACWIVPKDVGNNMHLRSQGGVYIDGNTIVVGDSAGNNRTIITPTAGRLTFNGEINAVRVYNAVYNDYAEYFLKDDLSLEAGDIVIKNKESKGYMKSRHAYDKLVVGIYSDDYAQCIGGEGKDTDEENYAPIGMAGRVRVKVVGLVEEGDLLVSSDIPGVAMASKEYKPGTVVGKALETHNGDSIDRIQILIVNM